MTHAGIRDRGPQLTRPEDRAPSPADDDAGTADSNAEASEGDTGWVRVLPGAGTSPTIDPNQGDTGWTQAVPAGHGPTAEIPTVTSGQRTTVQRRDESATDECRHNRRVCRAGETAGCWRPASFDPHGCGARRDPCCPADRLRHRTGEPELVRRAAQRIDGARTAPGDYVVDQRHGSQTFGDWSKRWRPLPGVPSPGVGSRRLDDFDRRYGSVQHKRIDHRSL